MSRYRVTVDTGGTFSDFVYLDEDTGEVTDLQGALDAGRSLARDPAGHRDAARQGRASRPTSPISATAPRSAPTRCSKARACETGLLVTEGFRGIYPVGEQARPYGAAIFDVMYDKPALLVPQSRTGEVRGARRFPRQRAAPARRGGAARDRARAQGAEDRIARGVPAVLVPASGARGRACARSCTRRCRAAASRSRPTSCRRSANITG